MALSRGAQLDLARRQQRALEAAARRMATVTQQVWDELGSWDRTDVARFRRRVAPMVAAAKVTAVRSATAYLVTTTGRPVPALRPQLVPVDYDDESPFWHHWHQLGAGASWDEAQLAGRAIVARSAINLLVDTSRQATIVLSAKAKRTPGGWERVLGGDSCAWCTQQAGQRYHSAESADIGHAGCTCTIVPVFN